MPRELQAEQIPELIAQHSHVFIQGGIGEPSTIVASLAAPGQDPKVVDYYAVSLPGINRFSPHFFHQGARFHSFFLHRDIAPTTDDSLSFHPLHYRDTYRFLERRSLFDAAIIQVAEPNSEGLCSFGLSVDFVPAVLPRSRLVIAQVNRQFPAVRNAPSIPYRDIDIVVNASQPLPNPTERSFGNTENIIAGHVAELVEDGSCIQIGIGNLPGSILRQLRNHRRLGLHSGLISEEARELIERGAITGENKTLDRYQHVAGLAFGGDDFYRWVADQQQFTFRPVNYTHEQQTLAAIDKFVSINSVLEVDLHGQANAEILRSRAISASGGLVDFVRGARASRGGKSILALPATAMRGTQSRIVSRLGSDAISSLCRTDIDHVVTEYGSASLFALDTEQRARALVDIAAPEQRNHLWKSWEATQR